MVAELTELEDIRHSEFKCWYSWGYNSVIITHSVDRLYLREDCSISTHLYFYLSIKKILFSHSWMDGWVSNTEI